MPMIANGRGLCQARALNAGQIPARTVIVWIAAEQVEWIHDTEPCEMVITVRRPGEVAAPRYETVKNDGNRPLPWEPVSELRRSRGGREVLGMKVAGVRISLRAA